MARYVDGFVVPVKKDRLDDYRKMAKVASKVWRELGAIEYLEAVADDVSVGKRTSFPRSVKLQDDEVVVFAFITYKSRAQRDKINKAVMEDPRMQAFVEAGAAAMPFDGKRMFWGGFKSLVEDGFAK
jgi:uncharacterized protein YbaA (DUF1428 family)